MKAEKQTNKNPTRRESNGWDFNRCLAILLPILWTGRTAGTQFHMLAQVVEIPCVYCWCLPEYGQHHSRWGHRMNKHESNLSASWLKENLPAQTALSNYGQRKPLKKDLLSWLGVGACVFFSFYALGPLPLGPVQALCALSQSLSSHAHQSTVSGRQCFLGVMHPFWL